MASADTGITKQSKIKMCNIPTKQLKFTAWAQILLPDGIETITTMKWPSDIGTNDPCSHILTARYYKSSADPTHA